MGGSSRTARTTRFSLSTAATPRCGRPPKAPAPPPPPPDAGFVRGSEVSDLRSRTQNPVTTVFANPLRDRSFVPAAVAGDARAFHRRLPGYAVTPLVDLPVVAAEIDARRVVAKVEGA